MTNTAFWPRVTAATSRASCSTSTPSVVCGVAPFAPITLPLPTRRIVRRRSGLQTKSMSLFEPSENIAGLNESATIAVSARAKELRAAGAPVIDLGAGEPDFSTPSFVLEAAQRALEAGATRYTQVEGI